MTFESLDDALHTLSTFSERVANLYQDKQEETKDASARVYLQRAIQREQQLRHGLEQGVQGLSEKQRHAMFKWQDRRQLMKVVPEARQLEIHSVDDVVSLVKTCDERAIAYCSSLTASTNSDEVLHLVESIAETREQSLRDYVWEAEREPS